MIALRILILVCKMTFVLLISGDGNPCRIRKNSGYRIAQPFDSIVFCTYYFNTYQYFSFPNFPYLKKLC